MTGEPTEWTLVSYELGAWETPPEKMPPEAEISTDPAWASVYRDGRPIATWHRYLPLPTEVVRDLRARADRRAARRRPGDPLE